MHLMQNVVKAALDIEPLKITCPKVDTPDGTPIRDYVDVRDISDAHLMAYKYLSKNGDSVMCNLGSGKGYSVLEIISAVGKMLGVEVNGFHSENRKGEYGEVYASYDKAKKVLGWEPKRSLYESVKSMFLWYKNHPTGFNA